MSVKVMGLVWDTRLPGNLKFLLLAYADAAEHDGTDVWPGQKRLADMTGVSVSTVAKLTRELLKIGVLVQTGRGHKGRRAAYYIPLDTLGIAYQYDTQTSQWVSDGAQWVAGYAPKGSAGATPPVLDPSLPSAATQREGVAACGHPNWAGIGGVLVCTACRLERPAESVTYDVDI